MLEVLPILQTESKSSLEMMHGRMEHRYRVAMIQKSG